MKSQLIFPVIVIMFSIGMFSMPSSSIAAVARPQDKAADNESGILALLLNPVIISPSKSF
jgi:hypothetical protein